MFKHFELLVLCFSTGLMVTQSPNVFGFICLLHLLNVTKASVGRAGVAGNMVRPARLSDRTIFPRLNSPGPGNMVRSVITKCTLKIQNKFMTNTMYFIL